MRDAIASRWVEDILARFDALGLVLASEREYCTDVSREGLQSLS